MKQELEKYLKTNRLRLDSDQPDEESVWEGIKSGLNKKQHVLPTWFWKVAAIFIFIVSATYFVVNETKDNTVVAITLADISDDLGNQEAELQHLVNLKWEEVKPLLPKEKTEIDFLLNEINELDKVYKSYQNDLSISDANEENIVALLDYYQKKMKILNRILHEIEKQKNHEKTIHL